MLNKFRVAFKILLCVSLIISFEIFCTYIMNLRPDTDGFAVSTLSEILLGDNGWTWELLYNGVTRSAFASLVIIFINVALDITAIIQKKQ